MKSPKSIWLFSGLVSLFLISALFLFVDFGQLAKALAATNIALLVVAIVPLTLEALITSKRIQYCAYQSVSYLRAVYCNAWYAMWLSVLPARLGEIAAVALFKRQLDMTTGGAIASIVVQRIYDVIVLCAILILLLSFSVFEGVEATISAILVAAFLVLMLTNLTFILTSFCHCIYPLRHKNRLLGGLLKVSLQARTWHRHHKGVAWLSVVTSLKWVVNLGTVILVFVACGVQLEMPQLLFIAVVIHFLGAIPIQSVGGFGVVEVGLTGLLVAQGTPPAQALATSLVLRFVGLGYAALFFLSCLSLLGRSSKSG